jgi:hypothetical protein
VITTPNNGRLWLKPGNYSYTGRLTRPMRIEPTYTPVRIGV